MNIILIVLGTKENGEEALHHLGVFSVCEDTKYAICNTCQAKVSRGEGSTKSYTTTNLVSHLIKHRISINNTVNENPLKKRHL